MPRFLLLTALTGCGLFPSVDGLMGDASLDTGVDAAADSTADAPDAPTSAYRAAVMADSPVAYWRFGDSTTSLAADEIGMHPGTGMGAALEAGVPGALAGDPNTAFHFGGASWVDVGDFFAFGGTSAFSVEVWAKIIDDANYQVFVSKDEATGPSPSIGWEIFGGPSSGSSPVIFRRYEASSYDNAISSALPYGVWTHLVGTFDGSTTSLYVNGALAGQVTGAAEVATTKHFVIGADLGGAGSSVHGDLDEVAIYDKALTAARVLAHYQAAQ